MAAVVGKTGPVTLKAYRGDAKTLLAFDIDTEAARARLAGFTIQVKPPGGVPYYILNDLRFETPGDHAQDPKEPAFATINAPIHKFRWVHVLGQVHQGLKPAYGTYTYTVTPRYFDAKASMLPLDPTLSVAVDIDVNEFTAGNVKLGFTRGFTQSQAFVRHFGKDAQIKPHDAGLQFNTGQVSGRNAQGEQFTYEDQYEWLGYTARKRIFEILDAVAADNALTLDVFAYDLNEPGFVTRLLAIGARARIILDNAALHHSTAKPKPEDQFETLFAAQAGAGNIKRGHFSRYSHDKVLIVSDAAGPKLVQTGSTNYSVTGLYVNSNHVLVFDDRAVAQTYKAVFDEAWNDGVHAAAFSRSQWATQPYPFNAAGTPDTSITFSPHDVPFATQLLGDMVTRINAEGAVTDRIGSVLFAVMELDGGQDNPVYQALNALHATQSLFSYGISDAPQGISLYPLGSKEGVLVTGKPVGTVLPPPFNQVPSVGELGAGHQVHHKFVVCGFNSPDAVLYCGSSNLALKGEEVNGDNLLAIKDPDIATAFAIEALSLVDHFDFLDRMAPATAAKGMAPAPAIKSQAAASAGWFLGTDDSWAHKYFDAQDLHSLDRQLFAG